MVNNTIKILAIDDNKDNLITIKALIQEAFPDMTIATALSGAAGIELAKRDTPDVILLDVVMPEMDGFEACKRLKANKNLVDVPIIFVTALKTDKDSRIKALEVGAEGFLSKPIDESELVAQLRTMLKIRFASIEKQQENVRLQGLVAERTAELKHTHTATLNLLEDLRNENEARKKIEQALSASEALYRSVIHASPDNITVSDLAGNITMISPKGLSLIGYSSGKELIGTNINDSLIPEQRNRAIRNLQGMFQGIFNGPEEYTLLKADGSTVDTEINAEFVRNENGEPTGFVFAIRDITERKEAQNRIKESERKYRLITEKITDVVWIIDLSGKSLFVSQSVEGFSGYTVDEYLYQSINDRFTPESAHLAIQELRDTSIALVETNEEIHKFKKILILDYKCKDGNIKTGELLITPYFDEDNKLIGIHGVTRDITRRQKAEDAVRTSEEKYRLLVENSPNGIAVYQESKFVYVNKAGLAMFGATHTEDLLGKPILSIVHPDSMSAVVERITQVAHGAEVPPLEEKLIRFDGSPFDAEVTALATTFNGKPAGQVIVSDITDRKLAVEKLRESEEKFRDMANLLPQVVFEVKLTGEITYINQQAEILFGYKTAELIGLNSLLVHIPEQRERLREGVLKKVAGNTIDSREFIMLRKDGTVFPALIYTNLILKDNQPVGLRGVVVDITEQKEAERKIKESQAEYYGLYNLLRLMSDTMPDMLWAKDLEGNYTFANKAMCERLLHANDTNEPIGKSDIFFAKREREAHIENPKWHTFGEICNDTDVTTISKMQQMQFDEYGMVGGQFLYLDVHKAPLLNEKNELIGVVGTARDITERKLAEEKVNYITRLYALLSHVNQAIVRIKDEVELFESVCRMAIEFGQFRMCWVGVFDEEKNILQPLCFAGHDDGYLEALNIDPDSPITGSGPTGRAFKENKSYFCNDVATDEAMTHWREIALHRGYKSSFATPLHRKGKKYGILTLYASEVNFFDQQEQALLQGIGVDVSHALDIIDSETERITAEEALMTSEAKYRELMDNSPEGITIYVDGKIAYINKEALRLMRANDKSEMLGKTIVDFIHPDNRELVLERMKMVAMAPLNAILPSVEEKYIRLDGTEVYVEIKVMPILYDGKLAIQLYGHDITDRKEAELALEQSQSELKTIYDHAPVMMCVVNPERKIQFANEAFTALTGISEELMRGGAVGSVIGCINSFDSPKGCGYGPNCKNCGLRMAMEDTFNRGVEYQNVEYHSTLTVGPLRKEVYLLGSTSLIQTSNQKQVLLCLHDITDRKLAEDALHKSEMLLRTFIENSPFEIWARDNDQIGILENKKLTDHYGTIIGHTPESDPRVETEIKELWRSINSRVFAGDIVDEEYEFMVNGEPRTFQQIVFPIEMNKTITGIAGFNIDVTERKLADESLRESREELKKFAAHLQNVREEERVLLAREIHDQLGQILVAVKIDMGMLKLNVLKNIDREGSADLFDKFDNLSTLIDNTIKTARRIMTDLRPEVLDMLGFIDTVKQHLTGFQDRHKVICEFTCLAPELNLSSQQSVALFRIIQEAMNNIAKHAKATKVDVCLRSTDEKLVLEVSDNGVGFDDTSKKNHDSYGLIGMKERVFLLEGELSITSKKGSGTIVQVKIPYKK
jgi:PAS domain S-box-containing protein